MPDAAGGVPSLPGAVPVDAHGGGIVGQLATGHLEHVVGQFLYDLAGVSFQGAGEDAFDVDTQRAGIEISVGEE